MSTHRAPAGSSDWRVTVCHIRTDCRPGSLSRVAPLRLPADPQPPRWPASGGEPWVETMQGDLLDTCRVAEEDEGVSEMEVVNRSQCAGSDENSHTPSGSPSGSRDRQVGTSSCHSAAVVARRKAARPPRFLVGPTCSIDIARVIPRRAPASAARRTNRSCSARRKSRAERLPPSASAPAFSTRCSAKWISLTTSPNGACRRGSGCAGPRSPSIGLRSSSRCSSALGRGCQAGGDPRTPHSPDPG